MRGRTIVLTLAKETRTFAAHGELDVYYEIGRDEDAVQTFLEQLRTAGLQVTEDVGVTDPEGADPITPLEDTVRGAIEHALARTGHKQKAAARLLAISPRVLNYKMHRLGIQRPNDRTKTNLTAR